MTEQIDDGPTPDDGISEDQVPVLDADDDTIIFDGDADDYTEDEPPAEDEDLDGDETSDEDDPEAVG